MQDTLTAGSIAATTSTSHVSCSQMPLSFISKGQSATIAKVRGKGDMHHHLENLGFVEGARVTVVSEMAGNLIVEIKGCQVALNKQVAVRIITQ